LRRHVTDKGLARRIAWKDSTTRASSVFQSRLFAFIRGQSSPLTQNSNNHH